MSACAFSWRSSCVIMWHYLKLDCFFFCSISNWKLDIKSKWWILCTIGNSQISHITFLLVFRINLIEFHCIHLNGYFYWMKNWELYKYIYLIRQIKINNSEYVDCFFFISFSLHFFFFLQNTYFYCLIDTFLYTFLTFIFLCMIMRVCVFPQNFVLCTYSLSNTSTHTNTHNYS